MEPQPLPESATVERLVDREAAARAVGGENSGAQLPFEGPSRADAYAGIHSVACTSTKIAFISVRTHVMAIPVSTYSVEALAWLFAATAGNRVARSGSAGSSATRLIVWFGS